MCNPSLITSVPPNLGKPLFSFGLLTDTHFNAGPKTVPSRYQTVNERNEHVLRVLGDQRPDFIIHLGDIVTPLPHFPEHEATLLRAQRALALADCPVHVLPGNHDIGDKPAKWLRAPTVTSKAIRTFEHHWGPSYSSFDWGPCRLILLNTPLFNSGLAEEHQQWEWLFEQLKTNKRCFLFTHYPPFIHDPDEPSHYENLDDPARTRLLRVLERYQVEALFSGHTHNPFRDQYQNTALYVLPSTAFFRPEYEEFYAREPLEGDADKLGGFMVRVYDTGHVAHLLPTRGNTGPAPRRMGPPPTPENRWAPVDSISERNGMRRSPYPMPVTSMNFAVRPSETITDCLPFGTWGSNTFGFRLMIWWIRRRAHGWHY